MSLGSNQGIALFREVSSLIDQRHLSPKSYTERIQNGVRNIEVALQNRAFRSAVSLQASNTQLANFRSGLSQLTNRTVSSRAQAEQVVGSAMQLAAQSGLRPGLVAYEFANGSIQSLDKYSGLDPSLNRVSGAIEDTGIQTAMGALDEYVTGVGIEVRHHAQGLEIIRALRGGPAVAAGIQSGDIIRQINGQNIGGMEMNQSVGMISGPRGAAVRFLVAREGRGTKTFSLVRRQFRVYSVNDVKMVDRQSGVGYMHLNKFAKSSAAEMEQAIQELQSQGMKNLIVDVRGNPGGLLTTAIEVSDKFLRCGKIVATRGRLGSDNMVESANASGTWSMPLVVLVDGDSASASEIFAAAIQENGRGIVVGEKSYGKGTVQTHFPLSSGLGTVRLTTAKFYSPTDREMSGNGVTPDVRASDEKDALDRAVTAASHPRLAEMVAQHGTCRPAGSNFGRFGSAAKPATDVSASLSK
jgi:carboxyl-terminal processing protease